MKYSGTEKLRRTLNLIISVICALLFGTLLVIFDNRGILLRPASERQVSSASGLSSEILETEDGCIFVLTDSEDSPGRYIERLSMEALPTAEKPSVFSIDITWSDKGTEHTETLTDNNPLYVHTEIVNVRRNHVTRIGIKVSDGTVFDPDTLRILNTPHFSMFMFIFGMFAALGLLLILVFRRESAGHPEIAFLISALCLGITMVICLPRNKVGNDEETHLQAVLDIASLPSGELHISPEIMNQITVTEHNNPDFQPGGGAEMHEFDSYLSGNGDYKCGALSPELYTPPNRIPAYLPMAAAMKIGKGLGAGWSAIILISRCANLFVYILFMFMAVRVTPVGKFLMMLIGLFPQNIFLASTFSYDPFVTSTICIGIAFMLRLIYIKSSGRMRTGEMIASLLFLTLGCLVKAVYAPLLLTAFIIPAARIGGKRRRWIFIAAAVLLFILMIATFILPTAAAPAATGDLRGGATSESSQVGFILSHPFAYTKMLIWQMIRWIPQCFFGADCITFMGHLVNGSTAFKGYWIIYCMLLVFTVVYDLWLRFKAMPVREIRLSAARRIWCFLCIAAACVLVWTSMFVSFTEPGAREIAGVQGRYFIPLMFLLYLLTGSPGMQNGAYATGTGGILERGGRICYYIQICLPYFMLALTIWTTVIKCFCS